MNKEELPFNFIEAGSSEIQATVNHYGKITHTSASTPFSLQISKKCDAESCYFKELNLSIFQNGILNIENCYIETLNVSLQGIAALIIQKTTIENLKISGGQPNTNDYSVVVKLNSKISVFNWEGDTNGKILFDSIKIDTLSLTNCNSGNHVVDVNNCVIENKVLDSVLIKSSRSTLNIFGGSEIKGGIVIESTNNSGLVITDSVVRGSVKYKTRGENSFQAKNSKLYGAISFEQQSNLTFVVQNSSLSVIKFEGCGFKAFTILGSKESKTILNRIELKNSFFTQQSRIDNASINGLSLIDFLNTNPHYFTIQNASIRDFINIENTQLGLTQFQNVDLDFKLKFKLQNSTIIESKFYTVNWMRDYRLVELKKAKYKSNRDKIQYLLSLKESYRQLKAISQAALNKFDALNFQRHEQRIQKEILWLKKEYWDFFLLESNQIFNNYGLSYVRPFRWLIGFHFVWFSILLLTSNTFDYNFFFLSDTISGKATLGAISDFLYTLFPLHSSEYLHKSNGLPLIIDLLMRLTSGYFIYYFLSATRKFHLN